MATLFKGAEVNAQLNARIMGDVEALKSRGVFPKLGIVRVGERPDDLSYERGAVKRAETLGVAVEKFVLPPDVSQDQLLDLIHKITASRIIKGGNGLLMRHLSHFRS